MPKKAAFWIIRKRNVHLPEVEKQRQGKKVEGASTLFHIFHVSKWQSVLHFAALASGINSNISELLLKYINKNNKTNTFLGFSAVPST